MKICEGNMKISKSMNGKCREYPFPLYGPWDMENFGPPPPYINRGTQKKNSELFPVHRPWDIENFTALTYIWAVGHGKF